jgi:hypothetical protein
MKEKQVKLPGPDHPISPGANLTVDGGMNA